jgi:hypothetical protein
MTQLAINFPDAPAPLARRDDPSTSHAAAAAARELQRHHHEVILAALRKYGPMGKDGIAARTRLDGVQVCRRLPELAGLGHVVETGKKVMSTSGREEREWSVA